MITTRLPQPGGMGWQPGRGTKAHLFRAGDVVTPTPRVSRYWNANGWWGDQGTTSQCTIFAWLHVEHDGPITHRGTEADRHARRGSTSSARTSTARHAVRWTPGSPPTLPPR
jgi:hypothetical protein